jgi:hypothetical protein
MTYTVSVRRKTQTNINSWKILKSNLEVEKSTELYHIGHSFRRSGTIEAVVGRSIRRRGGGEKLSFPVVD